MNRVKKSRTQLLDLEDIYPDGERVIFDIAPYLWEGIALKEKDFREAVDEIDPENFRDKYVAVTCRVDATIPTWAYMLIASKLGNSAKLMVFGSEKELENAIFEALIHNIDFSKYTGERVIIKGCSKREVPVSAYVKLAAELSKYAKQIMYGEPCSTVPVFKKPRR